MDAGKWLSSLSELTERVEGWRECFNVCLVSRGQEWLMMESSGAGFCAFISALVNCFPTLLFKYLLYVVSMRSELEVVR